MLEFKSSYNFHLNLLESDFQLSKIRFGDPNHLSLVFGTFYLLCMTMSLPDESLLDPVEVH